MPQLNLSQRQLLQALHQQQFSQAAIARRLGVHRSTVKRELERNGKDGLYVAERAHENYLKRKVEAGQLNQEKRLIRFQLLADQIRINVSRLITLEKRTPDSPPAKKRPYRKLFEKRYRIFRDYFQPGRKRKRCRQYRNQRYRDWKRWYDRRQRDRCYYVEDLGRFREYYWMIRYRYPWRKSYHVRIGWRVYKRLLGRLDNDIAKERAYWESFYAKMYERLEEKEMVHQEEATLTGSPPERKQTFITWLGFLCLIDAVVRVHTVRKLPIGGREPPDKANFALPFFNSG